MVNFTLYVCGCVGLGLVSILSLVRTTFGKPNPLFYNEKFYLISVCLLLIINRLCFFDAGILNIDESIVLSGSRTLGAEPWPWISVDPSTWGPLNFIPGLLLLKLAPQASYGELRMLYLLICVVPSIGLFFVTIRKITNPFYARICIIPLLLTFVFRDEPDLVHASSEHIPLFLYTVVICTIILIARDHDPRPWQLFVAGMLFATSFFSKLQVTPVFYFLLLFCFVQLYFMKGRTRDAWILAAGFIFFNITALLAIYSYGGFPDFVQSYIYGNLHYSARTHYVLEAAVGFISPAIGAMFPLLLFAGFVLIVLMYKSARWLSNPALLYLVAAALLSALGFMYLLNRAGHHLPNILIKVGIANLVMYLSVLFVTGMLILLRFVYRRNLADLFMYTGLGLTIMITAYCIAKPGRYYLHYVMLLFLPVYTTTVWVLIRNVKTIHPRAAVVAGIFVVILTSVNILQAYRNLPAPGLVKTPVDERLLAYFNKNKKAGDRLAVWGWGAEYNHEAGVLMGTRDLHFEFQSSSAQPEPARYYQERYLFDLRKNNPKWLLDLSAPGGFLTYEKLILVHFKAINSYVHEHYTPVYRSDYRVLYELKK
jgi:hypothetical protein